MLNTCPAQRQFIKQSVIHNIRIDGRNNQSYRIPIIKKQVIAHLAGSSYIYLQYQNVQIYTGIKIKVEQVKTVSQTNQIALELSSMRKLRDQQNDEMLTIQSILQQSMIVKLAQSKQMSKFLQIKQAKKHKLFLYIDVFFLTTPHISQLQLIVTGIKSALQSTTIPEIQVSYNQVTEQQTTELTKIQRNFSRQQWESIFIIGLICAENAELFVVDLRRQQYESMDACFIVNVVDEKFVHIQSIKGSCTIDHINKCVRFVQNWVNKKTK